MKRLALLAILSIVGLIACAGSQQRPAHADGKWKVGTVQKGKATWYGKKWHGKKTANGERYDMKSMTAAHKKLPFNSIVRVTNLKNDRSVTVRINNRGPYGKGRIIDVSRAAAKKLRMIDAGVVPVKIEVLKVGKKKKRKKRTKKRSS